MFTPPRHPVPVFPLPEMVLFPDAELPLHVFELRYRTMVRDALSGERWLAIATLKPGYELDYYGSPAFHDLGCLGRFEEVEWLPNDCYNLRLRGVSRVRFGRVAREFPYRACEAEVLGEAPYDPEGPLASLERSALLEEARRLLPLGTEAWVAPPVTKDDTPLALVVHSIAQCLRMDTTARLELLALEGVLERAQRLHDHLQRFGRGPATPEAGGRN